MSIINFEPKPIAQMCALLVWLGCLWPERCMIPCTAQEVRSGVNLELLNLEKVGIQFTHTNGAFGRLYIMESQPSGFALLDYDRDGLIDIYLLNGGTLPGATEPIEAHNKLFRNLGDWNFKDVTEEAGVGKKGYGLGVAAGDVDNDGDLDLYVTNFGPNVLYSNNGDGTFSDATEGAGVSDGNKFSAGACFLDIDADGDLDLYSANYQKFSIDKHFNNRIGDAKVRPGPRDFACEHDTMFENKGDGTFADISQSCGIRDVEASTGMGVIAADFNGDGAIDIFVANDAYPNFLFINDGKGKFTDEAFVSGVATDKSGKQNANMGIECADLNGDGLLDFFTTTFTGEMPVLYRQVADGLFEDATSISRIDPALLPHVNWGIGLVDFDNDGDREIFIANGHVDDNVDQYDRRTNWKVQNTLLDNDGKGIFRNITAASGSGLEPVESSRGTCFDDLDNDGWVDGVVLNVNALPNVLRNKSATKNSPNNHWLQVELVGTTSNRDAAGARVTVESTSSKQYSIVHLGRSYQSHYGTRLYFGLGQTIPQKITVNWPSGKEQQFNFGQRDRLVRIIEGLQSIE